MDLRTSRDGYSPVGLHSAQYSESPAPSLQTNAYTNPAASGSTSSILPHTPSQQDSRPPGIPRQFPMPRPDIEESLNGYNADRNPRDMTGMPEPRPGNSRTSSWDLLSGIRKFEHSYSEFDTRNASESHLAFAEGDLPKNKLSQIYNYLINVSIVTRWIIFIVPVMSLIWIPGIVGLASFPDATIWSVRLVWWSIWLTVAWGGWWASLAAARLLPRVIRPTLGLVAVGTRRYIDWIEALNRYVALFAWTLVLWASWNPLIDSRQLNTATQSNIDTIDLIGKLLFGFLLCAALLLFEKFSIQWIAGKFHERSYAERIADQKFAVKSLVTLYRNSTDLPGRTDTLHAPTKSAAVNTRRFFKKALKEVRRAATTTTTALGNVASEIAGSSVLQPNSPQAVVQTALESANKSRLLARRLFYSFAKPGSEYILVEDIARFFTSLEEADRVFALFDKDGNGDASRDEVEMACMDFHREQLSIEHSMQDLDSAVGRLDNILMSLYCIVAILIIAVCLEAQLVNLVTGAGTVILGLSWLIGGSLQEVLTSIIFLFIKHPFDVGDRITVDTNSYTVKEIRLLSTIFLDSNNVLVQAPNTILNGMFIQNIRRSPQMSETFTFDVNYATTFEHLEALRAKMLAFLKTERRDYQPVFDVAVVDFPDQEKMTLTVDIKYKSNSQQGALKAKRRNKWVCALKTAMGEIKVFGPSGDPNAAPSTARYTMVPWDEVRENERQRASQPVQFPQPVRPSGGWQLSDNDAVIVDATEDVFGEADELHMTNPRRDLSRDNLPAHLAQSSLGSRSGPGLSMPIAATLPSRAQSTASLSRPEIIEMKTNP